MHYLNQQHATILQQDNARPHTARHTHDTLQRHNINTLNWPAHSPDLSPIEHVWDMLGRRIKENHDVNNINELTQALLHEWHQIPLTEIQKLIRSMRRRCVAVINANDGDTRY